LHDDAGCRDPFGQIGSPEFLETARAGHHGATLDSALTIDAAS
jgi:hypothetical protein